MIFSAYTRGLPWVGMILTCSAPAFSRCCLRKRVAFSMSGLCDGMVLMEGMRKKSKSSCMNLFLLLSRYCDSLFICVFLVQFKKIFEF